MIELTQYFEAEKAVHAHIGYTEQWRVYPLEDSTGMYWHLHNGKIYFAESIEALQYGLTEEGLFESPSEFDKADYYGEYIEGTYKGDQYTGFTMDTHTDGNSFLSIFDNSKEVKIAP